LIRRAWGKILPMVLKKSAPAKKARPATKPEPAKAAAPANPVPPKSVLPPAPSAPAARAALRPPFRRPQPVINFAGVGRNDMCPCGSGKRFKNCHGH